MQYASVVKNLLKFNSNGTTKNACYVTTGIWTELCIKEARKLFPSDQPPIESVCGTDGFKNLVDPSEWNIDTSSSYIHYCQNETAHGF